MYRLSPSNLLCLVVTVKFHILHKDLIYQMDIVNDKILVLVKHALAIITLSHW